MSAKIDILIIKQHSHLGSFGGGCAFYRLLLTKISFRLGQRPSSFIENTINLDGLTDPPGPYSADTLAILVRTCVGL
ncbi:MAG TPA: hypothetical protein VLB68_09655 [Pyrinomonadaceae bacterium]|nr:hypothetical protein [Pyrinomonadaceae bacterium]